MEPVKKFDGGLGEYKERIKLRPLVLPGDLGMFHEIQKDTQAQPFIEKDFQHRERCWGLHNITTINCLGGKKEKDYTGYTKLYRICFLCLSTDQH